MDASIPEKDGYTPFHGAGFQGRASIARMLIKDSRGLDPNDRHKDGFQPIHRACWGGEARHAETVKVNIKTVENIYACVVTIKMKSANVS